MDKSIFKNPVEFLKTIQPLRNPDEIKVLCEELADMHGQGRVSPVTVTKNLSAYSKLIKEVPADELIEGKNAYIQIKRDGSLWKRHLYFKYTGIDSADYAKVNAVRTDKKIDRLKNQTELPVVKYFATTLDLLKSANAWELATGLIAASGRRPTEILVSGNFTKPLEVSEEFKIGYTVKFSGQAKKKGKEVEDYLIPVLVPTDYFLHCFKRFKKMPEAIDIKNYVAKLEQQGKTLEEIRRDIEDKKGKTLRRVCSRNFDYFGEETDVTNSVLRGAYALLVCERDKPKKINHVFYLSNILGHFNESEKNLTNLLTTLNYDRFYLEGTVPYPEVQFQTTATSGVKVMSLRAYESEVNELNQLRTELGKANQPDVIKEVLDGYRQREIDRKMNEILKKDLAEKERVLTEKVIEVKQLKEALQKSEKSAQKVEGDLTLPELKPFQKVEGMTNIELWNTSTKGCSEEKLSRSYQAITAYNDTVATEAGNRLAITNQALRALSGVNGFQVGEWIKAHADEVISHNSKYEMQNSKDPRKVETYYNKRHGEANVKSLLKYISDKFLDGVYQPKS